MRVFLFFLWFMGLGVGLPMLVMGYLRWKQKPLWVVDEDVLRVRDRAFVDPAALLADETVVPPTDVRAAYPESEAAVMGIFPDGTRALVFKTPDVQARYATVRRFYASAVEGKPKTNLRDTVIQTPQGETGVIVVHDPYTFIAIGPGEQAARARLAALPGITPNPERSAGNKMDAEWKPYVIGAVLVWAAFIGLQFCRMASWAGTVTPDPAVQTLPEQTVRQRLLAINEQDVPFTVTESPDRPDELVVDWRYADATWMDLLRAHGMRKAYRLTLRLDEANRTVRAREYHSELDWDAGGGAASLAWKGSLGITFFHYSHGRAYGLQFKDGKPTFDEAYRYTFDLRELKQPVIEAVTQSGWEYRPVLTWFRPIGG